MFDDTSNISKRKYSEDTLDHERFAHIDRTRPVAPQGYHWVPAKISEFPFLKDLRSVFEDAIEVFVETSAGSLKRMSSDGAWLIRARLGDVPVAVIWHDFRVNAGSYGKALSRRMKAFLETCDASRMPLVAKITSVGVRFMEGWTVFDPAFELVPALVGYRERNPVFTIAHGQTIGLGALAFRLGHYRVAIDDRTFVSLTGPEVCKMAFGEAVDFETVASAAAEFEEGDTVCDLAPSISEALTRIAPLIDSKMVLAACAERTPVRAEGTQKLVSGFTDGFIELFAGRDDKVLVYVGSIDGKRFGILANPLENMNNMVRVSSLNVYSDALSLFERLGLPVLSLLDTPGTDPRPDGINRRVITRLVELSGQIIAYPHPKMGIVIRRAFGGASVLGMPKVFGAKHSFALNTARMGIMHSSIIGRLVSGSPRLMKSWSEVSRTQKVDLSDLIESGSLDSLIDQSELRDTVSRYLLDLPDTSAQVVSLMADTESGNGRTTPAAAQGR